MINIMTPDWDEYELLDSGNGRKLERFGKYILDRIETQAIWNKSLPQSEWEKADAEFRRTSERGEWVKKNNIPNAWILSFEDLKLELRLTPFGHVGIFPDQSSQWKFIKDKISSANHPIKVLSLFTYTGASTIAAAAAGAVVTHVDASKPAITWARDNQKLSGLEQKPIRWIPEDALKFVKREVRRNSRYDAIIMDPPKFGRGTQGEVWKFEDNFAELLDLCRQILSDTPLFIDITAYAIPVSSLSLSNILSDAMRKHTGTVESGEIGLQQKNGRILPTAIFASWTASS
jgi:23S rRNA (cytosine1962-C5)-methyltransferase